MAATRRLDGKSIACVAREWPAAADSPETRTNGNAARDRHRERVRRVGGGDPPGGPRSSRHRAREARSTGRSRLRLPSGRIHLRWRSDGHYRTLADHRAVHAGGPPGGGLPHARSHRSVLPHLLPGRDALRLFGGRAADEGGDPPPRRRRGRCRGLSGVRPAQRAHLRQGLHRAGDRPLSARLGHGQDRSRPAAPGELSLGLRVRLSLRSERAAAPGPVVPSPAGRRQPVPDDEHLHPDSLSGARVGGLVRAGRNGRRCRRHGSAPDRAGRHAAAQCRSRADSGRAKAG